MQVGEDVALVVDHHAGAGGVGMVVLAVRRSWASGRLGRRGCRLRGGLTWFLLRFLGLLPWRLGGMLRRQIAFHPHHRRPHRGGGDRGLGRTGRACWPWCISRRCRCPIGSAPRAAGWNSCQPPISAQGHQHRQRRGDQPIMAPIKAADFLPGAAERSGALLLIPAKTGAVEIEFLRRSRRGTFAGRPAVKDFSFQKPPVARTETGENLMSAAGGREGAGSHPAPALQAKIGTLDQSRRISLARGDGFQGRALPATRICRPVQRMTGRFPHMRRALRQFETGRGSVPAPRFCRPGKARPTHVTRTRTKARFAPAGPPYRHAPPLPASAP